MSANHLRPMSPTLTAPVAHIEALHTGTLTDGTVVLLTTWSNGQREIAIRTNGRWGIPAVLTAEEVF